MNKLKQFFITLGKLLDIYFNQHKGARRLLLFWAVLLITYVVLTVTPLIKVVDSSAVAFVAAVIGLLATVIGFYQWSRGNDGSNTD